MELKNHHFLERKRVMSVIFENRIAPPHRKSPTGAPSFTA